MVVVVIFPVLNPVPVPRMVPPTAVPYQFKVPALAVAPSVTGPAPHLPAGVTEVTVGVTVTVAITGVLAEIQLPFEASA